MRRYSFLPLSLALLLALCSPGAAQSNRLTPTSEPRVRGASPAAAAPRPAIRTGFSCSPKNLEVAEAGNDRFRIRFPNGGRDKVGWFLFQVKNAAGRTLRIDLTNIPFEKWKTLHPLVLESENLDALENYRTPPVDLRRRGTPPSRAPRSPRPPRLRRPRSARSGGRAPASSPIPDDSAQRWKFIRSVTPNEETKALTLRHAFRTNSAYVAMRYPYTPQYHENYIATLKNDPRVKVHTVGESAEGRPLHVVQIGGLDENEAKRKPCIVLYAREHADEHDTSWLAQGAIDYLLSDNADARFLRNRITFLIIPLLDADGAAKSVYESITHSFHQDDSSPESIAYARFFWKWTDAGNRLDIAFNIHNTESSGRRNMECALYELKGKQGRYRECKALYEGAIVPAFRRRGYTASAKPWSSGYARKRLGGHLHYYYGTLHLPLELNSQDPRNPLTLHRLRATGAHLIHATAKHLFSPSSRSLLKSTSNLFDFHEDKRYFYRTALDYTYDKPFSAQQEFRDRPFSARIWRRVQREELTQEQLSIEARGEWKRKKFGRENRARDLQQLLQERIRE